ncbi:MAG: cation transporter [Chloroflexi bacterium]|jgi:cobalt-zinc-cadmium efflux system protein|nr:cation diffusion facilitator family transporter [Dehalococcoidia bacterium]RUA21768.1 MAG: cation transporter [Chloroflexota bacterium]RUA30060.1 MAG: cation transporter [Chloroflexota bacterium]
MDSSQQPILSPPGHSHDHRSASRRSLRISLALIMAYMVVEVVGGLVSGSLALLADAGHMLTDGSAISLALLAIWVSGRPASIEQTFGFHRTEILAALLNALSLWFISALIFFEASRRFDDTLDVDGGIMLAVGAVGLLVNLAAAWVLHRSSGESLNVEGAFLHVIADLLGSVAVVAGGILVLVFEWDIADPIFGIVIGVLILASSLRLLWKVVHVLMEGTPSHLDLHRLCQRLEELEGVTGVHDIHAWSITTGYDALSAHVTADPTVMQDPNPVLQALRDIASSEFGIGHVTIQLEDSMEGCVEDHHIEHPAVQAPSHGNDES